MLLTPQLDYQLMEHWAPSVADLLQMEAEEAVALVPTTIEEPSEARASFQKEVTNIDIDIDMDIGSYSTA